MERLTLSTFAAVFSATSESMTDAATSTSVAFNNWATALIDRREMFSILNITPSVVCAQPSLFSYTLLVTYTATQSMQPIPPKQEEPVVEPVPDDLPY